MRTICAMTTQPSSALAGVKTPKEAPDGIDRGRARQGRQPMQMHGENDNSQGGNEEFRHGHGGQREQAHQPVINAVAPTSPK